MMRQAVFAALAVLTAFTLGAAEGRDVTAPLARVDDVVEVMHGEAVHDPYRWLEDATSEETRAWTEAQNARTRDYLDAIPSRASIRARVESYIAESSPRHYTLTARPGHVFALYFDPQKQQPSLVMMGADADPARARVVLDPNALDATGGTAIDWYVPSHDGALVAVSLSLGGSEDGTLHIYDVATGAEVGQPIANVSFPTAGGDVAWAPDNRSFWYTRYPGEGASEDERNFNQQLYFHRLGDDPAQDAHVFGEGLPRVAEIKVDYALAAQSLLVSVQNGDGGEFGHYVRGRDGQFRQVTRFEDGVDFATFGPDRALYLVSELGAPTRRILKLAPGATDLARARTIVEAGQDAILTDFWAEDPINFAGRRMYVRYIAGGPTRVGVFDLGGRSLGSLDTPQVASIDEIEPVGNDLLYSVETYLTPVQVYRLSRGRSTPTGIRVTSPVSFPDVEVVRTFATSRDGTRVPASIIRRRDVVLNGDNPTLLYGYGGYGISETPFFLGGARRMWFDAGGVFVVANLRGGGEYGEAWHQQGALTNKQNVFDDFIAVSELLIHERYTRPERLAIRGGSNGGLLMGAVLTQRSDLYRAVVAEVGIFDSVRSELEPNGAFNITEFGTVRDEAQFRALLAYSPYHNVRDGAAYPAVYLATGENDGRVDPYHSRKFAARLQAATGSNRPVYLITRSDAGHGIGSPLTVIIDQATDYQAFLFDQLGMAAPSTPVSGGGN